MNDADVSHTSPRYLRRERLIASWRGVAQLGMLVDGRAHTWAGDAVRSGPERRNAPMNACATGAARLARTLA
ncbi:MAG: hypothetical protein ACTHMO_11440 [Rhodanobacteraceae bacterium]